MKKVLAFDIGGTNTRLALINSRFEVEKDLVTPTPAGSKEKFMENCIEMIKQFPLEDVVAIGAGVPGVVNPETGKIIVLPNVHIGDIDFGEILKKEFNLPVYLRNDAQVACLGEAYLGAGKKFDRVFFVTISTGLGGALCVDKKIQDYVTEVGHTLFNWKGQMIEFETIGGCNIEKFAKMNGKNIKSAKEMFESARYEERDGVELLNEWVKVLNQYIKLMSDSYQPDIMVFTGGLMKAKDMFFDRIRSDNPNVLIKECYFSEGAGLMGAGVYALQCAKII